MSQRDPRVLLSEANALSSTGGNPSKKSGGLGLFGSIKAAASNAASSVFSGTSESDRNSEASGKYADAGLIFINQKQDLEAARAYHQAGDAAAKSDNRHMATGYYQSGWARYEKTGEIDEGLRCIEKAIYHTSNVMGNFSTTAKLQSDLAKFYENGDRMRPPRTFDPRLIIETYQAAAESFDRARFYTGAITMSVKAAELIALQGDYEAAAQAMDEAIENAAMRDHAQTVKFMAEGALIHIAVKDEVGFDKTISRYCDICSKFSAEPRYRMVHEFQDLFKEGDKDQWQDACIRYKNKGLLDDWMEKFLADLWVKLEKQEDDFS